MNAQHFRRFVEIAPDHFESGGGESRPAADEVFVSQARFDRKSGPLDIGGRSRRSARPALAICPLWASSARFDSVANNEAPAAPETQYALYSVIKNEVASTSRLESRAGVAANLPASRHWAPSNSLDVTHGAAGFYKFLPTEQPRARIEGLFPSRRFVDLQPEVRRA